MPGKVSWDKYSIFISEDSYFFSSFVFSVCVSALLICYRKLKVVYDVL